MPSTVLDVKDKNINETDEHLHSHGAYVLVGKAET